MPSFLDLSMYFNNAAMESTNQYLWFLSPDVRRDYVSDPNSSIKPTKFPSSQAPAQVLVTEIVKDGVVEEID